MLIQSFALMPESPCLLLFQPSRALCLDLFGLHSRKLLPLLDQDLFNIRHEQSKNVHESVVLKVVLESVLDVGLCYLVLEVLLQVVAAIVYQALHQVDDHLLVRYKGGVLLRLLSELGLRVQVRSDLSVVDGLRPYELLGLVGID